MSAKMPIDETGIESPHSEQSQTRFSTPVSDLDDHRLQQSPRLRADSSIAQRGETASPHMAPADLRKGSKTLSPDVLRGREAIRVAGPQYSSRDFEHAVVDDDNKSTHEGGHLIEHPSLPSPVLRSKGTLRRSRTAQAGQQLGRSRDSSPSSRASSPANSVDAFADGRRRERANTVGSQAPSDIVDPHLQRTISGGTHHRRPTFTEASVRDVHLSDERTSLLRNAAEEDICFPIKDEPVKRYQIDFEELDEFVEKSRANRHPSAGERSPRHKMSLSQTGPLGTLKGLLHHSCPAAVPQITTAGTSPPNPASEATASEDKTIGNDEKLDSNTNTQNSVFDEKHDLHQQHQHAPHHFGFHHHHSLNPQDKAVQPKKPEPARFSFFSSELEHTIHASDFADLVEPGETFRSLFTLPVDSGVWWLDIHNPQEEELHAFQRAFGIHRLTTEDISTQEAREKVELFNQYYFVNFRSFELVRDEQHEDWEPVSVYMVVFREGIITITFSPDSPHAANVRKRIGKLRDYMALTADWICYAMIDDIVDAFGPPIHGIEIEADTIEDQVFVARTEDFADLLRQIGHCRKNVMSLMRLLGGKADVIKGFAKRCNEQYSVTPRGDIGLYLGDIQDHVVTMMSNLGHFEKMLGRSHSNYLAQLSVDHIAQGNRTNDNLSKITVLASVLVPLNLICGLFGMNVNVPGKNADGLGWFFGIIGVIVAIVVMCLAIARRMRFI